jgi:23S rRNA maturation mini-RNase III
MNELFKRALVVCTAVSAFAGGAYIGDSVISSYVRSKVVALESINASEQAAVQSQPAAPVTPKSKATFSFDFGK